MNTGRAPGNDIILELRNHTVGAASGREKDFGRILRGAAALRSAPHLQVARAEHR